MHKSISKAKVSQLMSLPVLVIGNKQDCVPLRTNFNVRRDLSIDDFINVSAIADGDNNCDWNKHTKPAIVNFMNKVIEYRHYGNYIMIHLVIYHLLYMYILI